MTGQRRWRGRLGACALLAILAGPLAGAPPARDPGAARDAVATRDPGAAAGAGGQEGTGAGPAALWSAPGRIPALLPLCLALALLVALALWQGHRRLLAEARRSAAAACFEALPVGLLLIDRSARIRYANAAIRAEGAVAAALLRPGERYADALRGLIDRGCFAGADPGAASMLAQASGAGAPAVGRHECQLSDGRRLLCSTRRLPGGEALVLRQDVPEAQARLTEIEALNRALETQMQRVGATNRALRALAYATAHDLRAPLNTATMLADLLFEEAAEAEARGLAADLRATLSGMARLIDDVRAYADAVNTEALNRDCDLHALAREALRARAPEIAASGARVALETLPRVRGHPVLLRQLLANLLDNALKFRAPDRALQLQLRACAGAAPGFSLSDNGIGIDAAYHERIFDLFQTLHPGDRYPGNGLGLPICRHIALAHGGGIAVASALGRGSCFTVTLGKDPP